MQRREFLLKSTITALLASTAASPIFAAIKPQPSQIVLLDKTTRPRILLVPDARKAELYAAQELVTYLEKITGQKVDIDQTNAAPQISPQNPVIVIGSHPLNKALAARISTMEETIIEARPGIVHLVGGKPIATKMPNGTEYVQDRGALYAVYNFLDELGVRWYRPEEWGEHVPRLGTIRVRPGRRQYKPVYPWRQNLAGYRYVTDETPTQKLMGINWAVRNRLNTNSASTEEQGGHRFVQTWEIFDVLFPPTQYFATHPEYYALIDGKRREDGQLCVSNPEVQQLMAEKVLEGAKTNPRWEALAIAANDSEKWCQCDNCKAMDDPTSKIITKKMPIPWEQSMGDVSMSDRVNIFGTIVANKIAKVDPKIRVLWFAYSSNTEVPSKVKSLPSNVIIEACGASGFADPEYSYSDYSRDLFDPKSRPNRYFKRVLDGYGKMAPMITREYWGGLAWMGPVPLIRTMKDRLQSYRKYPIEGLYNEAYQHWGPQGICFYFFTRLLWNPDLDIERELDLYCKNYYGPAYRPMLEYHTLLEDAAHAGIPFHATGFNTHAIYTPQVMKRASALMAEAKALIGTREPYRQRFEGVWAGHEYIRLVLPYYEHLKRGDKLEAAKAWERANKLILSYKDGDVFDNGVFFGSLQFFGGYNMNIPEDIQRQAREFVAKENA